LGNCLDTGQSLAQAILQALAKSTDKPALSAAVKNRFGRDQFNQQMTRLLALPYLSTGARVDE
jgi:hypothetical protein